MSASPRVNLLPREAEQRNRIRRQRVGIGVLAVILIALLAGLYVLQLGRVDTVRAELDDERVELQRLQTEQRALGEFEELERQAQSADTLLTTALGGEASLAGILQDVAAVMPTDAALNSMSISVGERREDPMGAPRPAYGRLTAGGESLHGHAPGVERFLLEFDKVASFFNVFFTGSTVDEANVATFSFDLDLGYEILTRRYADGVPEELR